MIIMVMCASRKEAQDIAGKLLNKRFIACANISAHIKSKFGWKGKIDTVAETLLTMKTLKSNFRKVETEVRRLHSYEVPEIIAIPVVA